MISPNPFGLWVAVIILSLVASVVQAVEVRFPPGRLAITHDGNQHDPDDIGALPMNAALLWAAGLTGRLVHLDHSNHLGDNNATMEQKMKDSAAGSISRFGIAPARVFDCQVQLAQMIANFKVEGDKSTAADPLWFVCSGPMETAWRCLNAVDPTKRQHIRCVSHSTWNETHADTTGMTHTWASMKSNFPSVIYYDLVDQNSSDGENDWSTSRDRWYWLRDSVFEPYRWVFSRDQFTTKFDPSDSGMVYWLISGGPNGGDQYAGWPEAKALLEGKLATQPTAGVIAINAGGGSWTAPDGTAYAADHGFTGGSTYAIAATAIANTEADEVFRSERYGAFSYSIPVTSGNYTLRLQFAETYFTANGKRVFDVLVEGQERVSNLDIHALVGARAAYEVALPVTVTDGALSIAVHADIENPKISAIIIVPAAINAAPNVTITSPANGAAFTAPASITVAATATDSDGSVTRVEFFRNGTPVGADTDGSDGWSATMSNVAAGTYALTARATDNSGAITTSGAVSVTVSTSTTTTTPTVVSLTLIDATNDTAIAGFDPIPSGATIDLSTLPSRALNLRANVTGTVQSVTFVGPSMSRTENESPYAAFGDMTGSYNDWTPANGAYSYRATAYTLDGANGAAGPTLTVSFTVTSSSIAAAMEINRASDDIEPARNADGPAVKADQSTGGGCGLGSGLAAMLMAYGSAMLWRRRR
jgi:hypothetical protein